MENRLSIFSINNNMVSYSSLDLFLEQKNVIMGIYVSLKKFKQEQKELKKGIKLSGWAFDCKVRGP